MQAIDAQLTRAPLRDVLFLSLVSALPPLSTDMYLSAMPTIADQWQVSINLITLSLILWFVTFSFSLLLYGPLSDKYGRKPLLFGGMAIFLLASLGCSVSVNAPQLIFFRMLQGLGAAGPSAMVMAIARDRYEGNARKKLLAYMGVIMALAPMVAPSIGAFMLMFASWRGIFVFHAVYALMCLVYISRSRESITMRTNGNLLVLLGRYRVVITNRRFFLANTTMGLLAGPIFGFIALSSVIYIKHYGLNERQFAMLFAFNAMLLMLGAFTCTRLVRYFSDVAILTCCMTGSVIGGLAMLLFGEVNVIIFAMTMGFISLNYGVTRPLSNHLVLDQVDSDIGSASSFSVFYVFMVGAMSMAVVSLPWQDHIKVLAWFAVLTPASVLAVWPWLLKLIATAKTQHDKQAQAEANLVTAETEL